MQQEVDSSESFGLIERAGRVTRVLWHFGICVIGSADVSSFMFLGGAILLARVSTRKISCCLIYGHVSMKNYSFSSAGGPEALTF